MGRYAEKTKVPITQTIGDIQKAVERFGATGFQFATETGRFGVMFKFAKPRRAVRFELNIPEDDPQGQRQRFRALLLVIKAKLASIEDGIETFDEAFMPHIVVEASGKTIGQVLLPQFQKTLETGEMPKLLPGGA